MKHTVADIARIPGCKNGLLLSGPWPYQQLWHDILYQVMKSLCLFSWWKQWDFGKTRMYQLGRLSFFNYITAFPKSQWLKTSRCTSCLWQPPVLGFGWGLYMDLLQDTGWWSHHCLNLYQPLVGEEETMWCILALATRSFHPKRATPCGSASGKESALA